MTYRLTVEGECKDCHDLEDEIREVIESGGLNRQDIELTFFKAGYRKLLIPQGLIDALVAASGKPAGSTVLKCQTTNGEFIVSIFDTEVIETYHPKFLT
jgi:hypothetical protein